MKNENEEKEPKWVQNLEEELNKKVDQIRARLGLEETWEFLQELTRVVEKYYQQFDRPKNLEKETEKFNTYVEGLQHALGPVDFWDLKITALTFYEESEIEAVRTKLEVMNRVFDKRKKEMMEEWSNSERDYSDVMTLSLVNHPEKNEQIPPVYSDGKGNRYQMTRTGELHLVYSEEED